MSALQHAFKIDTSDPHYLARLDELKLALSETRSVYDVIRANIACSASSSFWQRGLDGQTTVSACHFTDGLKTITPNGDIMMIVMACIARLHGVDDVCRNKIPGDRHAFFTTHPENWHERFRIVCQEITDKHHPVPLDQSFDDTKLGQSDASQGIDPVLLNYVFGIPRRKTDLPKPT
jgi:hypothetical protein